jgi:hypothetical protein
MRDACWLDKTIDKYAEFKKIIYSCSTLLLFTQRHQNISYSNIVCFVSRLFYQIMLFIYINH